jgi:hypothetical protein
MLRFLVLAIVTLGLALSPTSVRSADLIREQNKSAELASRPSTAAAPASDRTSWDDTFGYLAARPPLADRAAPVPSTQSWPGLPGHWRGPDHLVFHSVTDLSSWRIGGYIGVGNADNLWKIVLKPWAVASYYDPLFLVAGNAVFTAIEFPNVPLDIELEIVLAQHFGPSQTLSYRGGPLYYSPQSYQEFAIAPAFRWKWYPWNDYVYTNLRFAPFGFSYTTAISQWEALQTDTGTAKVLNFLLAELTLAPSPTSSWEGFVRVHHRSGVGGRVNNVVGGSNFVSTGARVSF